MIAISDSLGANIRLATMIAIAEKADAPIGSLYQFFPSKEAIADGLLSRYLSEMSTRWEKLEARLPRMDLKELRQIADVTVQLVKAANALSKHVSRRDTKAGMEEMEFALNSYLENRLAAWRRKGR
jgi:AcrR family transcriptional regulator